MIDTFQIYRSRTRFRTCAHVISCFVAIIALEGPDILLGQDLYEDVRGSVERETALDAAGLEHPDFHVREESSERLVALGDVALRKLFPLLSSDDPETRSRVNRILSRLIQSPIIVQEAFRSGEDGVAWIENMNSSADPAKRVFDVPVTVSAGYYGGPEIVPFLARRAASGDQKAAESLGLLGCPEEAFDEIERRWAAEKSADALRAAGFTGSVRARSFLLSARSAGTPAEKMAADSALANMEKCIAAQRLAVILSRKPGYKKYVFAVAATFEPWLRTRFAHCFLRETVAMDTEVAVSLLPSFWTLNVDPRYFSFRRCRHLVGEITNRVEMHPEWPENLWLCWILTGFYDDPRAVKAVYRAVLKPGFPNYVIDIFSRTGDFGVAVAIEERLARIPGADSVRLIRLVNRPPGALAVRALGSTLGKPDKELAREAAEALAHHATAGCIDELFAGYARGRYSRICAKAIAATGGKAGFDRLSTLLDDRCPPEIYMALGETRDRRASAVLRAASCDRRSARHALLGLGKIGDPANLDLLLSALADDLLWEAALDGIRDLKSPAALGALTAFARSANERGSRRRFFEVMSVIEYLRIK